MKLAMGVMGVGTKALNLKPGEFIRFVQDGLVYEGIVMEGGWLGCAWQVQRHSLPTAQRRREAALKRVHL